MIPRTSLIRSATPSRRRSARTEGADRRDQGRQDRGRLPEGREGREDLHRHDRPATKKTTGDPKEAAKDSDAAEQGKDLGADVLKAKIDLATAVDKALQRERKVDVQLAQPLRKEKQLFWLVQLKKGGVESDWEVDGESGKVSQRKPEPWPVPKVTEGAGCEAQGSSLDRAACGRSPCGPVARVGRVCLDLALLARLPDPSSVPFPSGWRLWGVVVNSMLF